MCSHLLELLLSLCKHYIRGLPSIAKKLNDHACEVANSLKNGICGRCNFLKDDPLNSTSVCVCYTLIDASIRRKIIWTDANITVYKLLMMKRISVVFNGCFFKDIGKISHKMKDRKLPLQPQDNDLTVQILHDAFCEK